jgi:hypothetical protein
MTKAGQEARAVDTSSVKQCITSYIVPSMSTQDLQPPLAAEDKASHGFFHPQTARLLCPVKYLDDFDQGMNE